LRSAWTWWPASRCSKPAGDGKPGDVLQYSATYRNTGAAAAAKLLATVPVPPGTTFIAASAEPAQARLPRTAPPSPPCR
jgi:uncharacterized repeat protein (TIGR01451 family)